MNTFIRKSVFVPLTLIIFISLMTGGCARYAHEVNALYEPSATIQGGSGEVYIVIPESQQTRSPDIKWVLGKVTDDNNKKIDEVLSPRSPAELIQTALGLEFKKAGYTVTPVSKTPVAGLRVINISKAEITLEQLSDFADIKATCKVLMEAEVLKSGQLIKRIQYEATFSKTDIKDRDLLARRVLHDALQSVMLKSVPDINSLLIK